ncbi:MAG: PAS domain-containing protein, partial [Phaeodactylibacter sp.]|nr:PAS domain-containing protein [Phaeodactylibacter sp.]
MKENISQDQQPMPLKQALELAERGYLLVNKTGLVQEMNAWLRTDLGYEEADVQRLSILIIYPTLNLLAWQDFWKKLELNAPVAEEAQFITKEGVVYPVKLKAQLIQRAGDTYCCFFVFNQLTVNRYMDLLYLTTQISKTLSWEYDLMHQEVFIATDNLDFFEKGQRDLLLDPMEVIHYLRQKIGPAETIRLTQAIRQGIKEGKALDIEFRLLQTSGSPKTLRIQGEPYQTKAHTSKFY